MAIVGKPGEETLLLTGWSDVEVRAVQACRDAAVPMLKALYAGGGCDATRRVAAATDCRRFGAMKYASAVAAFQATWQTNRETFANRLLKAVGGQANPLARSVIVEGLPKADGMYGSRTAMALSLVATQVPECVCVMQAFGQTAAGKDLLQALSDVRVVNQNAPSPQTEPQPPVQQPQPQSQQQPQQPQQTQITFQDDQKVWVPQQRETNAAVYWGVGIAVLLAAGGTWYYFRGRKGGR